MDQSFTCIATDYLLPKTPDCPLWIQKADITNASITSLVSPSATFDQVSITGNLKVAGGINGRISVKDYGAVGDGITDDLNSIQGAIDYVKTNGGSVYFPCGTYSIGASLNIGQNVKPFSLIGDGHKSIITALSNGLSLLSGHTIDGLIIEGLQLDGNTRSVGNGNYGISIYNSSNVLFNRLRVYDYTETAISVYISDLSQAGTYSNVWIKGCEIDGNNIANNGLLLDSMWNSGITECCVSNINPDGSPSYNLQFKNKCQKCIMSNCVADGGRAGIAFGNSQNPVNIGVQNCSASNCVIKNCLWGIYLGQAANNTFSNITIDMTDKINDFQAFATTDGNSLAISSVNNILKGVTLRGIPENNYIVSLGEYANNNFIEFDNVTDTLHTMLAQFKANSQYNTVKINTRGGLGNVTVLDPYYQDLGTNNEFILKGNTTSSRLANAFRGNSFENTSLTNYERLSCMGNVRTAGSNIPDFSLMTLPAGGIGNVYAFTFPATVFKEVFVPGVQMPNSWREGSKIYPHLHFVLTEIPTSVKDNLRLTLEYRISNLGANIQATSTQTITVNLSLNSLGITVEGYNLDVDATPSGIDMTNLTKGCTINCRLAREVLTGSYYTGNIYLTGFEFKYNMKYLSGLE